MDAAGIPALIDAIRHMHGCKAKHLETVHVDERFEGALVWEGDVDVFVLEDHATASRAYAWSIATSGTKRRFYAVLHVPPVDSALQAVRASFVSEARAQRS